ncbi:hypothetical protein [Herbiconiux sp.]|uniref:hypothetical protein n=1 Tax=Herbiconiux sp. TaxID=1871186 RepID=UPI0025C2CA10|nr:hypothetical protein [Herbiconiux sp.]
MFTDWKSPWMHDIHDYNGQRAIRAADLWEPFSRLIHRGGEATRIVDRHGSLLYEDFDDGELARPEVDRGRLRDMLLDSLPDATVRGRRCAHGCRRHPLPARASLSSRPTSSPHQPIILPRRDS